MNNIEPKHILGYLPYGLKILRPDSKTIVEVSGVLGNLYVFFEKGQEMYGAIRSLGNRPILRPMSELTKDISYNGEKFKPIEKLQLVFEPSNILSINCFYTKGYLSMEDVIFITEKLHEWHFDIYDLISKGLAININNLTNYESRNFRRYIKRIS